jgi:hypothetical protein
MAEAQAPEAQAPFKQDFTATYHMVAPQQRCDIIKHIDMGNMESECVTGIQQKWWTTKHHPAEIIPTRIYLLGDGTIEELFQRYVAKHSEMEWSDFINYTRELIKQRIMQI